jgi:hypothetical protein
VALVADDGLIGVAMTQAVRHIIIMVWGTGLALGYFACIARALRVRAGWRQRLLFKWRVRTVPMSVLGRLGPAGGTEDRACRFAAAAARLLRAFVGRDFGTAT